jgi:diguanylate cyclase (GGDEF)-like protein
VEGVDEFTDVVLLAELVATQHAISASEVNLEATLDEIVVQARRLTLADAAVVELVDGDDLVHVAVAGSAEPYLGLRVPAEASFSGLAVRTGEILTSEDTRADPRVDRAAARRIGARSLAIVPIRHRDADGGVLKAYSRKRAAFGEREVRVLQILAASLGAAFGRARLLASLDEAATTDSLTRLPNLRAWEERAPRELARAARSGGPLCLALLELEHFGAYDEELGHHAVDRRLAGCAAHWAKAVRVIDLLARIGREKFALLLPDCGASDAVRVGDRLRWLSRDLGSASVGVAQWDGSEPLDALVARAEAALRSAKQPGRDVVLFGDDAPSVRQPV